MESTHADASFGRRGSRTRSQVVPRTTRDAATSSATGAPFEPTVVGSISTMRPRPGALSAGVATTTRATQALRAEGARAIARGAAAGAGPDANRTAARTAPLIAMAGGRRTADQPVTLLGGDGGGAPRSSTVACAVCVRTFLAATVAVFVRRRGPLVDGALTLTV